MKRWCKKRQYASLSSLFAQLFIELPTGSAPLYLVIDDYHLINNPVIHDAMRFFLRHQPENMTLVVLSRNLPQLGIANLRVRDQLLEIGSQQLAFTHQEAKQFFDCRLTSPIEADDSSRLCDDVAGWATALQLIALSARQNNSSANTPPNTPPAASPGLTPAICRIIWWMKYWITLTPARATFC
ncbi:transcriptional regulator MalT [Klebsiella pneumoniae]|uniref:Transcriptional regulator MalT n=1 Tax=Klebsiella pneumoniae TaxID=573 RepID=A0A377XK12_KLEPN|nr:transcriptional regulator MalT [Klebsiella pneumoniae]